MYYAVYFHLKSGRMISRKATIRDAAIITGTWDLDPHTKTIAINFEHPDSPPVVVSIDSLEYIDFVQYNK